MEPICTTCEQREHCQTLCKEISKKVWKGNRMMEDKFDNHIVLYPQKKQIRFSEIEDYKVDNFSNSDVIPWSSSGTRLLKTSVFIERFFNKTPVHELAERFGVNGATINSIYSKTVNRLSKVIEALDARKAGVFVSRLERFTKEQKFFMLVFVFGFSNKDVAEMFNYHENTIEYKVARMARKYGDLFAEQAKKDDTTISDPPMSDTLTDDELISIVDAYFQQGLPRSQAYIRIAERLPALHGRRATEGAIKKRYYKTMAAGKNSA